MILIQILLWSILAQADAPAVFAQDPLCDTSIDFKAALDRVRPYQLRNKEFRPYVTNQNKWLNAATRQMRSVCEADKKFAQDILKRDRSALTGQCKPAAEAAQYDQEMLAHSEENLKILKSARENLLNKGVPGSSESLKSIFPKNFEQMKNEAVGTGRVPLVGLCEILWIYPAELFINETQIRDCPEAPSGLKTGDEDKKDPALFGRILTRFTLSTEYNQARRNNALATATASMGKYEACIAQHPEEKRNVIVKNGLGKSGGKASVPSGSAPQQKSDITGIKEDEQKRAK